MHKNVNKQLNLINKTSSLTSLCTYYTANFPSIELLQSCHLSGTQLPNAVEERRETQRDK